jgi:hypothetical protein
MKTIRKIKKEQVWLGCTIVGPILAFAAVYYPALSVLAIIFIIIGIKGILTHVM